MASSQCGIVLVIDDNPVVGQALQLLFEVSDMTCEVVLTPQAGLARVQQDARISLVIQDMNFTSGQTAGQEGQRLFLALREARPGLPIILMTAWTELATAVSLVKQGAADYLAKPWDDQRLIDTARQLLAINQASSANTQVESLKKADLCGLVYRSPTIERLLTTTIKAAASDVPVLITGPNGAGKEKIAQILQANSPLREAPFIKVNVGALPKSLMEAELFGAEKGAYTGCDSLRTGRFEAADGGTLFLDEIGNLSAEGQSKLLRVIQSGEYQRLGSSVTRQCRVRLISATNCDLVTAVQNGEFREDLYYRLNVIELRLPALHHRKEDILPLVHAFLPEQFSLGPGVAQALQRYSWPGNVRELQNACRRATIMSESGQLQLADFGLPIEAGPTDPARVTVEPDEATIRAALNQHQGVVAKAARALGLSRQALYRRLEKLGIRME